MTRVHATFAATLAGAILFAGSLQAQTTQAPPLKPILEGKKFVAPVKGQADVELTKPTTKREKGDVITKIVVKNISSAPIARLTVAETWYGKDNQVVAGNKGFINGLLQPGEIKTIEIVTPFDAKMNANNWNFSHANGTVKTHIVKSLDLPKEPAAKAASTTKTPKKK